MTAVLGMVPSHAVIMLGIGIGMFLALAACDVADALRSVNGVQDEARGAGRKQGAISTDGANDRALFAGLDVNQIRGHAASTAGTSAEAREEERLLNFACTNEYEPVKYSKWEHLAEPFRETTLTAVSRIGDPARDVFHWVLSDDAHTIKEGREIRHTFQSVGSRPIRLVQTIMKTGETYEYEGQIMVKYVRREIRQLTDKDREAFLDAVETIYRLPSAAGNEIYGEEYKGIDYFIQMHLDGAGVKDCDHWHDDAGVMTHHVGFTLLFEQGLQVLNPAISIPYWEYTVESARGEVSYGQSEIFQRDWFGMMNPDNAMHTIPEGRFAFLPIVSDAVEKDYVHNPYGLLRTPWNLDSTPYLTRHNMTNGDAVTDMVTCSVYSSSFNTSTLALLNTYLNGGTHGPVHVVVGGVWGNPLQEFIQAVGYTDLAVLLTKSLWRRGWMRLPESCSEADTSLGEGATCRASCPKDLYESRGMTPYDVLKESQALYWLANEVDVVVHDEDANVYVVKDHEEDEEFQLAFWAKVLQSVCEPGFVGEMFTSAAPYDPIFWVLHPTSERYLNWRRMLARHKAEGWDLDETWGYSHSNIPGDMGTVCEWSEVQDELDMPHCIKGICGGHGEFDVLPFRIKIAGEVKMMTNAEWLDFIYPDTDDLPYVYNEYRWDHCASLGYSLGTIDH